MDKIDEIDEIDEIHVKRMMKKVENMSDDDRRKLEDTTSTIISLACGIFPEIVKNNPDKNHKYLVETSFDLAARFYGKGESLLDLNSLFWRKHKNLIP